MPRLAANLTLLFTELPFLERFAAAAAAGFRGVEFLFPYDHPPAEVAARLADSGLALALFNLPPGDWGAGERGLAALPGREADFDALVERALPYVEALRPPCLHVMSGIPPADADPAACRASLLRNLRAAAAALAPFGTTALLEPLNPRDNPGYYLTRQDQALALLDAAAGAGAGNTALQLDLYHCQIVEGDLATTIRAHIGRVGHIQIAGVPERHEPSVGEVNYPYLLALIDSLGYPGWIGCEYRPAGTTTEGLGWAAPYLGIA